MQSILTELNSREDEPFLGQEECSAAFIGGARPGGRQRVNPPEMRIRRKQLDFVQTFKVYMQTGYKET